MPPAGQLSTETAHGRACDLLEHALQVADAEGIPKEQILLALADMLSAIAWKSGGEAQILALMQRIDATIDVLSGRRLPLQNQTKN